MNGKDRPKNLPVIVQMIMAIHNNNNSSTNSDDQNSAVHTAFVVFHSPYFVFHCFRIDKKNRVFFHPSMGQWNNTATRYLQKFKNMLTHNSCWSSQTICSQQVKLYCEQNLLVLVHKGSFFICEIHERFSFFSEIEKGLKHRLFKWPEMRRQLGTKL